MCARERTVIAGGRGHRRSRGSLRESKSRLVASDHI